MLQNIQAVIFDLDGTLLDTLTDLKNSLNAALVKNGLPERSEEEVRKFVGNGLSKLVSRAVGAEHLAKHPAVLKDTRIIYAQKCLETTAPYPGILPLLQTLSNRGMKLAVVSNKPDAQVKTLCADFFGGLIHAAVGQREGVPLKPAPDSVFEAMSAISALPEHTVYVGDSDVDIQTAEHAGIPCISVLWGFRDKAFLQENGAVYFVSTPQEINNLI